MYEAQQLLDTPQGCCPQSGRPLNSCLRSPEDNAHITRCPPSMNRHSYTPTLVHKGCVHTVGRRRVAIRCELLGHGGAAVA